MGIVAVQAPKTDVVVDFPDLSWAEAVGFPDFISDLKEVKGKTDAGL